MGNCTSKKSGKVIKLSTKKPGLPTMDKQSNNTKADNRGLSKKIVPFTKGEATSFGFKRRPSSALPAPVTLTSKTNSPVATACCEDQQQHPHVNLPKSTPILLRKKDIVKQRMGQLQQQQQPQQTQTTVQQTNRFGFRQPVQNKPPQSVDFNCPPTERVRKHVTVQSSAAVRSKSEGPREAFFKQKIQSASSMHSVLAAPRSQSPNTTNIPVPCPSRFTLQTTNLPRPQFAVRLQDTKAVKTVTNYYRKGGELSNCTFWRTRQPVSLNVVPGAPIDSNSSKEGSLTEDSGIASHPSTNTLGETDTLHGIEIFDSSPTFGVRKTVRKLEMKINGNKFELHKQQHQQQQQQQQQQQLLDKGMLLNKLSASGVGFTSKHIINTGLVQERANQFLRRMEQNCKITDTNRIRSAPVANNKFKNEEFEEEKLLKDSRRNEKHLINNYILNDGESECEYMLPGEAMAEDISISLSSDDDLSNELMKKSVVYNDEVINLDSASTPNSIRIDALKLSEQLKFKSTALDNVQNEDEMIVSNVLDEDTFPSDSMLEQLTDSDTSSGNKQEETKNTTGEADLAEDTGVELQVDVSPPADGTATPDSPGTPTNASNSLSLSDGRDFLIDDEIADQPDLCFSEKCQSYNDNVNNSQHDNKTMTSSAGNYKTCSDDTAVPSNELEPTEQQPETNRINKPVGRVAPTPIESAAADNSPDRKLTRASSLGTLSPCESLNSDDLMLDFETSGCDERFDSLNDNASVDGVDPCVENIKNWSNLNNKNTGMGSGNKLRNGSGGSSTPGSPRGAVASSLRSSLASVTDDETSVRVDKSTYQHMFQDIVSIKTMLLKLKRVLLESENNDSCSKTSLMEIDGLSLGGADDEVTELKRQITFLQQQLEERQKTVETLQCEVGRSVASCKINEGVRRETCNAATQTDRMRPVSAGPSIINNLPSDTTNLVSRMSQQFE